MTLFALLAAQRQSGSVAQWLILLSHSKEEINFKILAVFVLFMLCLVVTLLDLALS